MGNSGPATALSRKWPNTLPSNLDGWLTRLGASSMKTIISAKEDKTMQRSLWEETLVVLSEKISRVQEIVASLP